VLYTKYTHTRTYLCMCLCVYIYRHHRRHCQRLACGSCYIIVQKYFRRRGEGEELETCIIYILDTRTLSPDSCFRRARLKYTRPLRSVVTHKAVRFGFRSVFFLIFFFFFLTSRYISAYNNNAARRRAEGDVFFYPRPPPLTTRETRNNCE
jgi:hypothetical protein